MRPETPHARTARAEPLHRRFRPIPVDAPGRDSEPSPGRFPALHPGEPETCRRDIRVFLAVWLHLGLLLGVMKVYRIEGRALLILTALAAVAFPFHYWAHYHRKKAIFLGTSVLGLFCVYGLATGACVSAIVLTMLGLARLPISWWARVVLLGTITAGLAWARFASVSAENDLAETVWPIAASLLMFRMLIYLYELKHAKEPISWGDTLGYFFLLPNFSFLHFPVVDFRTYQRGFFAKDQQLIQVTGLRMMFRGMIHLMGYRFVYHRLMVPMDEVASLSGLAIFLVANYLLYLRVSGQFHLACGMIHLFGYNLPTTHNNYLLADSFTDYWRRVNIYWKDFMIRLVFNPVAFSMKRRPRGLTLAVATASVFVVTWFLHAYQSFWLRGTWGFSAPDALFWGILGILVLINVQFDARRSDARGRSPSAPGPAWSARLARAGRIAATFTTLALLWSLWSSPSLSAWCAMFSRSLRLG